MIYCANQKTLNKKDDVLAQVMTLNSLMSMGQRNFTVFPEPFHLISDLISV